MAQIYRPAYTLTDPTTGKKARRKSKTWHIRYYTPDGQRRRVKGYTDRKATESLAAELEKRAQRVDGGFADALDEHAARPLAQHAEDFRRRLAAKGNTPAYIDKALSRLAAVLDGCRFVKIADVRPSAVEECLAALRRDGKSIKTANDYLDAVKGFTRWLWKDRRTPADPLAGMSRLANGETDVRHALRDFAPEELRLLLDAAGASPATLRRLTGADRRFLYLTACATGFRASELASLTPESFDLDGEPPTATVQAGCTKNRQTARQPLPIDIAEALRPFLAGKPVGVPLWPGQWNTRAFLMIQRDLEAARANWLQSFQDARQRDEASQSGFLAYRDAAGRFADFHALRHSYITMIGKTGVSPKEHQDLARHSTYALTGRYTHSRLYDLAAAVNGLPSFAPAGSEAPAATGTDGKILGPNLSPQREKTWDKVGQSGTEAARVREAKNPGKQAVFAVFQGSARVVDKVEPRGIEPLTSALRTLRSPS
jgi:site-specific recombinase XerD